MRKRYNHFDRSDWHMVDSRDISVKNDTGGKRAKKIMANTKCKIEDCHKQASMICSHCRYAYCDEHKESHKQEVTRYELLPQFRTTHNLSEVIKRMRER